MVSAKIDARSSRGVNGSNGKDKAEAVADALASVEKQFGKNSHSEQTINKDQLG